MVRGDSKRAIERSVVTGGKTTGASRDLARRAENGRSFTGEKGKALQIDVSRQGAASLDTKKRADITLGWASPSVTEALNLRYEPKELMALQNRFGALPFEQQRLFIEQHPDVQKKMLGVDKPWGSEQPRYERNMESYIQQLSELDKKDLATWQSFHPHVQKELLDVQIAHVLKRYEGLREEPKLNGLGKDAHKTLSSLAPEVQAQAMRGWMEREWIESVQGMGKKDRDAFLGLSGDTQMSILDRGREQVKRLGKEIGALTEQLREYLGGLRDDFKQYMLSTDKPIKQELEKLQSYPYDARLALDSMKPETALPLFYENAAGRVERLAMLGELLRRDVQAARGFERMSAAWQREVLRFERVKMYSYLRKFEGLSEKQLAMLNKLETMMESADQRMYQEAFRQVILGKEVAKPHGGWMEGKKKEVAAPSMGVVLEREAKRNRVPEIQRYVAELPPTEMKLVLDYGQGIFEQGRGKTFEVKRGRGVSDVRMGQLTDTMVMGNGKEVWERGREAVMRAVDSKGELRAIEGQMTKALESGADYDVAALKFTYDEAKRQAEPLYQTAIEDKGAKKEFEKAVKEEYVEHRKRNDYW